MKKRYWHLLPQAMLLVTLATGLATAQAATISGVNLTTLETTPDLNSRVDNNGQQQIFGGTAYGTFLAVDDGTPQASWPLFGPATVPAGGGAQVSPYSTWSGASQVVSGTGTTADPWVITTTGAQAGATGIAVTQTDTLVDPDEFYRTAITATNTSATDKNIILYRAMDCFLGASDAGFGMLAGNTVGCVRRDTAALPNNSGDPSQPISRVEQFLDPAGTAKKELNSYGSIWETIGLRSEYTDQCLPNCDLYQDNGMGMSWRVTIPAGASLTFIHYTLFSPTGTFPLTTAATVAPGTSLPGGTVTYTITVTNPNTNAVNLQSVSFQLPAGFSFVPGSSAGGFPQPTVAGSTVTWTGSVTAPSNNGVVTITFNALVGAAVAPGTYTSDVSGTAAGGFSVMTTA
ncbi:MAG: DUF11 domain-containing protein, partial [Ottowia sp.]|nr:DUF11 domain-containing protein [Ottowia sp.]